MIEITKEMVDRAVRRWNGHSSGTFDDRMRDALNHALNPPKYIVTNTMLVAAAKARGTQRSDIFDSYVSDVYQAMRDAEPKP
jgi:hypothetical protein